MSADDRQEPPEVGSVGEEAAKLFGALSDWAREHGADLGTGAGERLDGLAGFLHEIDEHVATGAAECRYCPLCRLVGAARTTSPEVRQHLGVAASSLLQAAAGLMTSPTDERRSGPVERIDLDAGDDTWD